MSAHLQVIDLEKRFTVNSGGLFRRSSKQVCAVDKVSFDIRPGEALGLVGESGSGKTTIGRAIMRGIDASGGQILFQTDAGQVDIAQLPRDGLRSLWSQMQMIFQDPYSSLNPRMTVREIIGEALRNAGGISSQDLNARIEDVAFRCGLSPDHLSRYPHAFSGGQRQRICIARALILRPRFVVCDEPVSALDVSIQAQILNLLKELQAEFGLSYLFIAHDLNAVAYMCERVAVLYLGRVVEIGDTSKIYFTPKHPYTEALMSAVPSGDPRKSMSPIILQGERPNPADPPTGCHFHTRCRYATDRCKAERPALREVDEGRSVACHFANELELTGAPDLRSDA